jgi:hypothetical protein
MVTSHKRFVDQLRRPGRQPSTIAVMASSSSISTTGSLTRSRTLLFLSYRDSRASTSSSYPPSKARWKGKGREDESLGLLSDTDETRIDIDGSGLPPQWVDLSEEVDEIVERVRPKSEFTELPSQCLGLNIDLNCSRCTRKAACQTCPARFHRPERRRTRNRGAHNRNHTGEARLSEITSIYITECSILGLSNGSQGDPEGPANGSGRLHIGCRCPAD